MSIHGTVVSLHAGDYAAEVAEVGATLLSLTHRGRPPDAFNRDPDGVLLQPGQTRRLSLRISAVSPD